MVREYTEPQLCGRHDLLIEGLNADVVEPTMAGAHDDSLVEARHSEPKPVCDLHAEALGGLDARRELDVLEVNFCIEVRLGVVKTTISDRNGLLISSPSQLSLRSEESKPIARCQIVIPFFIFKLELLREYDGHHTSEIHRNW